MNHKWKTRHTQSFLLVESQSRVSAKGVEPGYKGVEHWYKEKLVACSYAQLFCVDYLDSNAPAVEHYPIKMVLAIVGLRNLDMLQLDIKTAFMYAELNQELYLLQPKGYFFAGKEGWVARLLNFLTD